MSKFISVLSAMILAGTIAFGQTPDDLSAQLTADMIAACQTAPDAYANFETCIAEGTLRRDLAVATARAIAKCEAGTVAAFESCIHDAKIDIHHRYQEQTNGADWMFN